jgi:hypothetical protein
MQRASFLLTGDCLGLAEAQLSLGRPSVLPTQNRSLANLVQHPRKIQHAVTKHQRHRDQVRAQYAK